MVYVDAVSQKKLPTYDLSAIKVAFSSVKGLTATSTAIRTAAALGFGRKEIVDTIQKMESRHFYKSMTSHNDYKIWQDVYYVPSEKGTLYVKFTAGTVSAFMLLSFKEEDNG